MKVIVLTGGSSPEREISLRSGKQITKGLREKGIEVLPLDPALGLNQPDNEDSLFRFDPDNKNLSTGNYIRLINSDLLNDCDVVFIALHGKFGEDGTVQSLLELRGKKYTGSGVLASALTIDKAKTKIMLRHNGIRTPDWILVKKGNYNLNDLKKKIINELGTTVIIKPNDQGSSIGFTLIKDLNELENALELCFRYSDFALIESFIKGRELTSSILGDRVLPTIEIKPKHEIYDFECKYTHGMSQYICPAEIPVEIDELIKRNSISAYKACECSVFSRVDFILNEYNIPYCLEINTIPGMTELSLVPMAAKKEGIKFPELVEEIIKLSMND